jgi:hypothetical protein
MARVSHSVFHLRLSDREDHGTGRPGRPNGSVTQIGRARGNFACRPG